MGFYKELGDRLEKWLKEKIKVVDTKVESIAKYHKYVNTELLYCHASSSNQGIVTTKSNTSMLNHFDIKTPMTSYHEFNKIEKAYTLINKLKEVCSQPL